MDVFCLLLDCLFFWFALGCVWLLFLCVLFWLAFRFALFLVRISVLIAFPVCSVSVPEHGMQKAPRHSGADCFPNRSAATGATGAISIRWPAQNHLRYRTVAWKTIHSPGGSIWSIGFGTGLAVRRRISSLGPISGPNDPIWSVSDIGSDKWSKLGLWLHSSDSSLFGPFDPWGKWSKWSWLIYSFEPIYR